MTTKEHVFKEQYNLLIKRHKNAIKYLDNQEVPPEEREKHIPAYIVVLQQLEEMIEVFHNESFSISENEILEWFNG